MTGLSADCLPKAAPAAAALYSTFCQGRIHLTDATTAEMAKLVENAYRDVNIAFANELSVISGNLGHRRLGPDRAREPPSAGQHPAARPRCGRTLHRGGPMVHRGRRPRNAKLIKTAREVNDSKPGHVVAAIEDAAEGLEAPAIAALGLAFKANVDDTRESPAVQIVQEIAARNPKAQITVGSPFAGAALPRELSALPNVSLAGTDEALAGADVVALLVDHDAFRDITPDQLAGRRIVDTRGFWRN